MEEIHEFGSALVRLGCALAAGGALGWEREMRDKPAGLRTNMLVALGSALLMLVAMRLADSHPGNNGVDATRVIQGIVGGIGFLGAGTIIHSRHSVHGLTTASTIWLSAAAGVSSGAGYHVLTAAAVLAGLLVLTGLGMIEARLLPAKSDPSQESPSASKAREET